MFETIEPAWVEAETKRLQNTAKYNLQSWLDRLAKPFEEATQHVKHSWDFRPSQYVTTSHKEKPFKPYDERTPAEREEDSALYAYKNGGPGSLRQCYEGAKIIAAAGGFKANLAGAAADARKNVAAAKASFVAKQTKKIGAAVGGRPIEKIAGELTYSGAITGYLNVEIVGGDFFGCAMSIVWNNTPAHRNWGGGGTTFYVQFPTRFASVQIAGATPAKGTKLSEKWMIENFAAAK